MRNYFLTLLSYFTLLAVSINPFVFNNQASSASQHPQPPTQQDGIRVIEASFVGQSQPLRSITPADPEALASGIVHELRERLEIPKPGLVSDDGFDASIIQDSPIGLAMPSTDANFEGVSNINGVLPPDTNGDIGYDPGTGKKYYVQWVNLSMQIWNVTDPAAPVSVYGPSAGNVIWNGTGTLCESHNDGDPIVLFDHLANRWLISQFALSTPNNFHQCIAVSTSADPTGSWYLYDFQTSTSLINDYPKFGVWPDGYYMTVNQFNGATNFWEGAGAAVFERSAMLNGLTARMIYIDVGAVNIGYGGMLPSDLDGPVPPAGTPNYFMEWDNSTWLGDATDTLRIWEFNTDWSNPSNSTFGTGALFTPNYVISTSNVDPNMCGYARSCIPQPGTTSKLDAISDRLMYRLQFRDFGAYQTLVSNHTVDTSGSDTAGIHWLELHDSGSGWTLHQEGVYAPDSDNRWMGSIAMDTSGNIALGYSVSSASTYPSIRYTGRLAGDPLGTLPQGETSLIAGSGSQTHSASRWGDYSMMAVDPVDGCTFWYTQEYYQTTSLIGWQTRVGSFKFPSCSSLPTGTLTGEVSDGTNPIVNASVAITGSLSTSTDSNGIYKLNLAPGTYDVTASKYGYNPSTAFGVSITSSVTTTLDFTLSSTLLEAPSNLIATAVSHSQIDLSWSDNSSDETAFHIERSPDGVNWSEIDTVPADTTSYSDTGLGSGERYSYRVRAFRLADSQFSQYSNVDSAAIPYLNYLLYVVK